MRRTKTILVVDDDQPLAEAVQMILEDEGYDVVTAYGSKQIDELMETHQPDLVILDYRIPGEDGVQVAHRLKQAKQTKDTPIVMMSASYSIQKPAMEAGADVFLPKPFSFTTLIDTITKFVQYGELQTEKINGH